MTKVICFITVCRDHDSREAYEREKCDPVERLEGITAYSSEGRFHAGTPALTGQPRAATKDKAIFSKRIF